MPAGSLSADQVLPLIEEAIQATPGKIAHETVLEGLDGWDSMGMVLFMGLVHERTGVELSVYELRGCATARALADLVSGRTRK